MRLNVDKIRTETNWIGTDWNRLNNDKQTVQKNRFKETSTPVHSHWLRGKCDVKVPDQKIKGGDRFSSNQNC